MGPPGPLVLSLPGKQTGVLKESADTFPPKGYAAGMGQGPEVPSVAPPGDVPFSTQHISIPQPDCPTEARTFSFYLSNIGRDSPQGSFDCIQQYVSR